MKNDPRLIQLTEATKKIVVGHITPETILELVNLGYRCYKQGMGIDPELVIQAIENGFKND